MEKKTLKNLTQNSKNKYKMGKNLNKPNKKQ